MNRRGKNLTDEDRILWSRVARTATPLPGKAPPEEEALVPPGAAEKGSRSGTASSPPASDQAARRKIRPRRLDATTREKLGRGRLAITGRIDLHGLTQEEAHMLLLSFLHRAQASGRRYVLVITGKGSSGEGILRRAVPQWLSTHPFKTIVGAYDEAARRHGGAGALYVRLRRNRL